MAAACLAFALAGCKHRERTPDTLVMDIESSPENLDLRIGADAQSEHIGALVFESLVRKDEHYRLQPWLAQSWEWSNPQTLLFHLRPGVHFHDDSPLTAADVAWSIESMHNGVLLTTKSGSFANVIRAEATDPLTCVVHLAHADAGLLFNLSDGLSGIVKAGAGKNAPLIGTGPFRFRSQATDKEVLLDRNPKYWGTSAKVEHLRFNVVPDETTRALELRNGSADIVSNALRLDTVAAMQNDPRVRVEDAPGSVVNYLTFNVHDRELSDPRIRQAIAYAIDRPALIRALFRGRATPASTLLPPGHWAAPSSGEVREYKYDPVHAKKLLEEAGKHPRADGVRLRITLKTSTDDIARLIAAVMQQQLRQVGIAVEIRSNEFGTFYSDVSRGAFQMYVLRWLGANEDPDIFRYAYATESFPPKGANRGRFSHPHVDALIAQGGAEADETKRRAIYLQLQRVLADEEPTVPLWFLDNVLVHSDRVTNIHPSPSGDFDFLRTAELRAR